MSEPWPNAAEFAATLNERLADVLPVGMRIVLEPLVTPSRDDGYHRDAALVAALWEHAAAMDIKLMCTCGRAIIDADGICDVCESDLPARQEMDRWEIQHREALRRHELAVKVECPYCGAKPDAVCLTYPTLAERGILDHKDRYRAACSLLERAETAPED